MSATEKLESSATKHVTYTERFSGGLIKDNASLLVALEADLNAILATELTDYRRSRLTAIQKQVKAAMQTYVDDLNANLTPEYQELAVYESAFQVKMIQSVMKPVLNPIPDNLVTGLLSNNKMKLVSGDDILEITPEKAIQNYSGSLSKRLNAKIRQAIQLGIAEGDSLQRSVAVVRKFVKNTTASETASLIRTISNHVSQTAYNEAVNANKEYFDTEYWSSILDSRVSVTCAGLDGREWPIGDGVYPPAHYRCRSRRLVRIKPEFGLNIKATRASQFGAVNGQTTQQSFMRRQSKEYQEDILGVERTKLFRSGEVSLDKFIDDQGIVLTLKELAKKEGLTLN